MWDTKHNQDSFHLVVPRSGTKFTDVYVVGTANSNVSMVDAIDRKKIHSFEWYVSRRNPTISIQLHGVRADGSVAFRKKLSLRKLLDFLASQPRYLVAMEGMCCSAPNIDPDK